VKVNIGRNVADFTSVDGDLVGQHARGGDLDGIGPVVVVVAQSICEVQDGLLGDLRSILSDIEVSGLDGTLGDRVRNEEEIESALDDL